MTRTRRTLVAVMLVAFATAPASAQMMGGPTAGVMGGDKFDMMPMSEMMSRDGGMGDMEGCPGMAAVEPTAIGYERPWISFALAHSKELALTPDQVKGLTTLREDFRKDATRWAQESREGEAALARLYAQKPLDWTAIESKVKELAAKQAELRLVRVKVIDKGVALLTEEQRQKLFETGRIMGRMMGALGASSLEARQ